MAVKPFPSWAERLDQLRGPGQRRASKSKPSLSLAAVLPRLGNGAILIDIGCGESGDASIARSRGVRAFGLDLFPPANRKHFICADATKPLPFADASINAITSHAMIALLSPSDRWALYAEVARVLKPRGLFSLTPYPLSKGYPIQKQVETWRVIDSGFHREREGVYMKCSRSPCDDHPKAGSWDAVMKGLRLIDTHEAVTITGAAFIALLLRGGNIKAATEFSGLPRQTIQSVYNDSAKCGIADWKGNNFDLPWMSYFDRDEIREGNLAFCLDMLVIRGEVKRVPSENGEPLYTAS